MKKQKVSDIEDSKEESNLLVNPDLKKDDMEFLFNRVEDEDDEDEEELVIPMRKRRREIYKDKNQEIDFMTQFLTQQESILKLNKRIFQLKNELDKVETKQHYTTLSLGTTNTELEEQKKLVETHKKDRKDMVLKQKYMLVEQYIMRLIVICWLFGWLLYKTF